MAQVRSLKTGIKFKDTPIGKIPVDWEVVSLSNVTELNMGQSPSSKDCNDIGKGLPFYQGNADFGSKHPAPTRWCINPSKIAKKGDILISVRAPVGEMNIAPHDCCIGRGIGAIHANTIKKDYLYQAMLLFKRALEKVSQGSTFEAINKKELSDFLIPSPSLPEQEKIAEILSNVDDAIEETDRIIEKTKELKKGLMQNLLTHGIGHKKFKKTEIGEIPEEWEVTQLGDICEVIGGSTPSTANKENWNGDILWATPTDITALKGRTIDETKQKISEKGLSSCATKLLPKGAILLTSRATIGACAINTKPMATNQGFASLICKEKVFNWFVYYVVAQFRKELERLGSGSTFREVSKKSVKSLYVPFPPLDEQKKIVKILSSIDTEIDNEINHKQELESLKKSLMQVLLAGKVRVKIG